ncbi:tether containing UBX domain for GLUT4 [Leptidea sinapis]|uniref:tether containing UBX domain for GLUT4 n=1 Tax=Leptidea sinapis TaxID=189913 RepID=UPI002120C488|nr:tether containing UBX domain for GLUT4 [Leptidea sinapis]
MSRDIIILAPNGRRIKVHCTPDTSFLQVLEDVCEKQGYEAGDYDLKHHNHIVDLTTTIRFCNIPNKATLEMVEAERKRVEANVTVGLMLQDGDRRTADFSPNTTLHSIIVSLAENEFSQLKNPSVTYMRQEVVGVAALKEKTLRQLGLIAGRAILRLLEKTEPMQANVSSVYRSSKPEKDKIELREHKEGNVETPNYSANLEKAEASDKEVAHMEVDKNKFDTITSIIKNEKQRVINKDNGIHIKDSSSDHTVVKDSENKSTPKEKPGVKTQKHETQEELERRLRIEEEVTFVGSQKAIAFMQPDEAQDELSDLPDDFYELSIEEVRKIYHELQQKRMEMENTPLMTTSKRAELNSELSQETLKTYKNVVVRVQFPDRMILQGVFTPSDTIQDIQNFVRTHLQDPDKQFQIFSTPLKKSLDPKTTLLEAKFVPCVHMHFRWLEENSGSQYLKQEIYSRKTSSDAASILASKYRAPSRRKLDDNTGSSQATSSSSKQSKVPKWFKK